MKDIMIETFIQCLPDIMTVLMAVVSMVVLKKIVPCINAIINSENAQTSKKQLAEVKEWIEIFISSAQRLHLSGKLNAVTKKEYVIAKIMDYVQSQSYHFTQEQLEDIRRAAVYTLEQSELLLDAAGRQMADAAAPMQDGSLIEEGGR